MEPTVYGYARVSTRASVSRKPQHVENQVERLRLAGAEVVFSDTYTGRKFDRPQWSELRARLQPGDTLLVTKMDRLGRSLTNLVDVIRAVTGSGVRIRTLDNGEIDPSSPNGKLMMGLLALLAEWEADMARERTIEGMEAARERHGGVLPPRGLAKDTAEKIARAEELARTTTLNAAAIAAQVGLARSTLYRHLDLAALKGDS